MKDDLTVKCEAIVAAIALTICIIIFVVGFTVRMVL